MGRSLFVLILIAGFSWSTTYMVTTVASGGAGSLAQAVIDANNHPGQDTITFSIKGTFSPPTTITDTVVIDASSQFTSVPGDTILNQPGGYCLNLKYPKANQCVVRGLFLQGIGNAVIFIEMTHNNTIGGGGTGQRNVISGGANLRGIWIWEGNENKIIGNYIGTNGEGNSTFPNLIGIEVTHNSSYTTIGGGSPNERNLISGNSSYGISISDGSHHNIIKGNYIGTAINGQDDLGNTGYGINLDGYSNVIGGIGTDDKNIVAFNKKGVVVQGNNVHNKITRNSIFDNDQLGIDLGDDGPGIEFGSPNDGIAPPVIVAEPDTVRGTAAPYSTVEIFKADPDTSGYGEGKTFITSGSANSSGMFAIAVSGLVVGDTVTATATDSVGNTSEFSKNKRVEHYQPDNWIATTITPADDYIGNDTLNTDGKNQTKSQKIVPNDSAVYYVKIQNDGSTADSFQVKGAGTSGAWTVSYYDSTQAGTNITAAVTGSGWFTKPLAATTTKELRLVVKAGNVTPPDTLKEILVTSASTVDTTKKDAVKAMTAIKYAQPDMQIALLADGFDYEGNGIYNLDGTGQTKSQNGTTATPAVYYIKIENDGNFKDVFSVKGDSGSADWQVSYYDAKTDGTNITANIIVGTFKTDSLDTGGAKEIRVEVAPQTGVPSGMAKILLIRSISIADTTKRDLVKAITTAVTAVAEKFEPPLAFALAPLAPNPAFRTTSIRFALPVRTSVRLSVYDATGRIVTRLVGGATLNPGRYEIEWQGINDANAPAQSGIYFVEMRTDAYRAIQKMIFIE